MKTTSAGVLHLSPVNSYGGAPLRRRLGYGPLFLDVEAQRSSETSVVICAVWGSIQLFAGVALWLR